MNYIAGDMEKIKLIDTMFNALSLEEVKEICGADAIVAKLKGIPDRDGPLVRAAKELQTARSDIEMIRGEYFSLKNDLQILIRCLNKGIGDASAASDFSMLKNRHSIY